MRSWELDTPAEEVKEDLEEMLMEFTNLDAFAAFTPTELENIIQIADVLSVGLQKFKVLVSSELEEQQKGD